MSTLLEHVPQLPSTLGGSKERQGLVHGSAATASCLLLAGVTLGEWGAASRHLSRGGTWAHQWQSREVVDLEALLNSSVGSMVWVCLFST